MKKILLFLFCVGICISLTACSSTSNVNNDNDIDNDTDDVEYYEIDQTCNHNWKNATCLQPKTCTICGETEGEALGHTYKNAKCTRCGERSENYSKIQKALNDAQRYVEYVKLEGEILSTNIEQYNLAKQVSYSHEISALNKVVDTEKTILSSLNKIIEICDSFDELSPLTDLCYYDIPGFNADDSNSVRSFISSLTKITHNCIYIPQAYSALCEIYR